ncbi:MAG: hypothetical protein NC926_11465 [Candidatus Omnitrophica bacterium]|nr:hypothetical protein [Candidatus Omnitrophota bacterium]
MEIKDERYEELYKLLKEIPPLTEFFKEEFSEEEIKRIWEENIENLRVPVVICSKKYTAGIGGIIESRNSILTDWGVLERFLYTSILEKGIFRDIFYLIKLVKKLEEKWVWDFIKEFLKNKEIKKEYDSRVCKLKDKEDFKIALIIQIIYSRLSEKEIEEFHDTFIKEANKKIIKNIKKWSSDVYREWYGAWYDDFYFGYKKDTGEKYLKCYTITRYGVIKDISFCGKEMRDPVKLLAEKIDKYINEDEILKLKLQEKLEKYPEDIKSIDKIYEYIMETPDLEEGELKKLLMNSKILEKIFDEVVCQGKENEAVCQGKENEVICQGKEIREAVIKNRDKNENENEIIYRLLLLALGFELPAIRMDYSKLDIEALREKLKEYNYLLSGAMPHDEEKNKIKEYLGEIFKSLEYFLSYFVPFIISKEKCKGCIENLMKKEYRREIREILYKDKTHGQHFTLGDFVNKLELEEIKFDKQKIDKLKKITEYRNKFSHPYEVEFDRKIFEEICNSLDEVYEYIKQKFPFFILKINQFVDDSNARKYFIAEEIKTKRKWYITFENEKMYYEIDTVYFYCVSSSTNPVARNPFMMPFTPYLYEILKTEND